MLTWMKDKLEGNENLLLIFIGDSITYGQNHCTADETYVACLARLFAAHFPHTDVIRYDGIVKNERSPIERYAGPFVIQKSEGHRCGSLTLVRSGVGGNTVARAMARRDDFCAPFVKGEHADIYFTMFGINDALKEDKTKYVTPEMFYQNYRELLCHLRTASPDARFVLMTPTYNDNGKANESHLAPYCDKVKQLAKENGVHLIDTHALWMEHLTVGAPRYGQGDWLSDKDGDSCHFSPTGSSKTASFIFENLW